MMRDSYILGVICYFHDASACLLKNGRLVAMAEEERFNRQKHTWAFPTHAIDYCLATAGISLADVAATYYGFKPWGFLGYQVAAGIRNLPASLNLLRPGASYMPLSRKLRGMLRLRADLAAHFGPCPGPVHYVGHHDTHLYSSYFVSPFDEAAILVADGFGEDVSTTFAHGQGSRIQHLDEVRLPNSLGVFYSAVTQYLGFRPHSDEYKVMGMAAYGSNTHLAFFERMLRRVSDFQFELDLSYVDFFTHGVRQCFSAELVKALGPARVPGGPYEQRHYDIARSAQTQLENVVVGLGQALQRRTGSKNLCVAGGVGQNVLMNRELLDRCGFTDIYVPPVSFDAGSSLGAALAGYARDAAGERAFALDGADWGPGFDDERCAEALAARGLTAHRGDDVLERLADRLAAGKVAGFFTGRMEIGPRALGHRSILADPRRQDIKDILNSRIKLREFFRPFAPVVPVEDCQTYFDLPVESPFMTLTGTVKTPELLPGITHQDGTARIQTVHGGRQPVLHRLLKLFGERTGVPVLINTSFNENEPIVCRPAEAVDCFLRTKMDVLVFNGRLFVEKHG
jgi:carbamoyltransferase